MILQADYKPYIKDANLLAMIQNDTTILDKAEDAAIGQVREYLFERYDMDTELAKVGSARNQYLLRVLANIVLYLLHKRLPKRMMPDHVQTDYNEALGWLREVQTGNIPANLDRLVDADSDPIIIFKYGGDEPRSY